MQPMFSMRETSRSLGCALATLLLWSSLCGLSAQLTDLQPGRNYPTASPQFGGGRTVELDVGDVDNDGDLDVGTANGGDGSAQANGLYINQGGAQGGVEGGFVDESLTRFAGLPVDRSRDLEFADFDADGDLDVYIANTGLVSDPLVGIDRSYRNAGGMQAGSIGFFTESTDSFWGSLVSVPAARESGVVDGSGPWGSYSCDCEFGDMDSDGDLDLFHTSYGPAFNGSDPSRIFLNDGSGQFNEHWPWVNAGGDIELHTVDVKLADFDGDLDLDIFASSRDSQARVFRNALQDGVWVGDAFRDVTLASLVASGATQTFNSNYAAEFGDVDGDGDFDVWAAEYAGFSDRLLINNGFMQFSMSSASIVQDTGEDNENVTFVDYDGDGDLDAFLATFAGTNTLYQNGSAQGLTAAGGLFHRTGVAGVPPETPTSANGGTSLDGEVGDMDGDGDPDLLLGNDNNASNRLWLNDLGVPDTHAPSIQLMSLQADKTDGSDTPVVARVDDNSPFYLISTYSTDLWVSVDGGVPGCQRMSRQHGQQFRAVIPGGLSGDITYWVEATDDAGNVGQSAPHTYSQTGAAAPPLWQILGCGTEGVLGIPQLELSGTQVAGSPVVFDLRRAAPSSPFLLWISLTSTPLVAVGGTVFAFPVTRQLAASSDAGGQRHLTTSWPAGLPVGTQFWWQVLVADSSSPHGLTLSNAVKSTTP